MAIPEKIINKVKDELSLLDEMILHVDGKQLKPSNCYYFGSDPLHILYNTNCPDSLKEKIDSILSKYIPRDESSSH